MFGPGRRLPGQLRCDVLGDLDKVIQEGGANYFDVMNFHYYIPFRARWDPYGPGLTGKAAALRQKLASYGVNKPFICTETSLWSDATHGSDLESQARHVPKVFARTMAAGLQASIWYRLFDSDQLGAWQFGLLDVNVNPKPSYHAYETLYRQLAPASYVRTLDPAQTGSDQIEAYEFLTKDGSTHIVVAWTEDEQNHPLVLDTSKVVVVDKFGQEAVLHDGADGQHDGRVQVNLGPSPVYLRFQP